MVVVGLARRARLKLSRFSPDVDPSVPGPRLLWARAGAGLAERHPAGNGHADGAGGFDVRLWQSSRRFQAMKPGYRYVAHMLPPSL
jgi:hypothetical protein